MKLVKRTLINISSNNVIRRTIHRKVKKNIYKIFGLIFLLALVMPMVCLAGLKLEQTYPMIPGITDTGQSLNVAVKANQTKTATNTASLIKYFTDLAFFLTIGLAVLSLIVAGVQYFSSSGNAGAMKTARGRAIKSFIGVAIIVLSYSILQIIMPTITIPALTRVGNFEDSNIILFSNDGKDQLYLRGNITKETIDDLVDEGLAKYANSQNISLVASFGQMMQYTEQTEMGMLYFENFSPEYIGFYGTGKENIEVRMFSEPGFLGTQTIYTNKGTKNDKDGSLNTLGTDHFGLPTNLDVVPIVAYQTPVAYFNVPSQKFITEYTTPFPKHPPLSYYMQGIGAGVYLYGSTVVQAVGEGDVFDEATRYTSGKGGQRYLQTSYPDFASQTFSFDNDANKIEIKNKKAKDESQISESLLAVLFTDAFYRGQFRIFFEKIKIKLPKIYMDNKLDLVGILNTAPNLGDIKSVSYYDNGLYKEDVYDVGNIDFQQVASDIGETIEVNGTDLFGFVSGASSAGIFKIADIETSTCEKVTICNGEDLSGYCLSFTPQGKESYDYETFTLPMPWFLPVSIPKKLTGSLDGDVANLNKDNNNEFADNIRSIGIKGNCLVALFENSVKMKNIESCVKGSEKKCWDNGEPGKNSQLFTQGDMVFEKGKTMTYLNLTNQPIGSCTKREWLIKLKRVPCASAIAVFPIK